MGCVVFAVFNDKHQYLLFAVPCQTLQASGSGSVNYFSNGSVSTATFTCDVGTSLQGSMETSCDSTGQWNFEEPNCGIHVHVVLATVCLAKLET